MLQMGNIVKNLVSGSPPTLASAITGPLATCVFHFEMNGAAVSSGMGTCGLVGQIGVYTGWVSDIVAGTKTAITPMDWAAMVRCACSARRAECDLLRDRAQAGWIKEGDLKLNRFLSGKSFAFMMEQIPAGCGLPGFVFSRLNT